ncbi:hypothetical protein DB345_02065 [Spartobacteria bacterium LR76]|nr:hypothetical protein DB345_02065 [Spartobacteria bacterium LR76]
MRILLIGTAAVSLLIPNAFSGETSENNPDWRRGAAAGDGSWSWVREVPQKTLDSAPRWQPGDGECPLAPEAAYKKAVAAFQQLDLGEPAFESLTLSVNAGGPFDVPAYNISLRSSKGCSVSFLVFLDGSVVSPKFEKRPDLQQSGERPPQKNPQQRTGLTNQDGLAPVEVGRKYYITLETTHTSGSNAVFRGAAVEVLEHGRGPWFRVRHLGDGQREEPIWVNFDFVSTIQPE